MLRSISIKGEPGLLGIQDLSINFNYPLTVISGKNGCGKTTALALAALAFHSPAGHKPTNARRLPLRGETSSYYTFSDFFFNGPNDPHITGVEIGWTYHDQKELRIQKRTKNWMRYQSRPKCPVHYLGVIRCAQPASRAPCARISAASLKAMGSSL
jgi:AAA15 family ATPase/GTPase